MDDVIFIPYQEGQAVLAPTTHGELWTMGLEAELSGPAPAYRLSDEQAAAVYSPAPLIVCVAGPGSGKTHTMITRIKRLVDEGNDPADMVAITFTNKAAAEIQKRLGTMKLRYLGTLHGFCLRMLMELGWAIGYDKVTILDPEEATELMAEVAAEINIKTPLDKLMKYRETGVPAELGRKPKAALDLVIAAYIAKCVRAQAVDFTGILEVGVKLAEKWGTADDGASGRLFPCKPFGKPISHLFVDEFQDSGLDDYRIYKALPAVNRFMVGDPDQAIFGFRGGRLQQILDLCDAPGTTVFALEGNYRSGWQICDDAQMLIEHNKNRVQKRTVAVSREKGLVEAYPCENPDDEIASICVLIRAWKMGDVPDSEIAVLARTNAIVKSVADRLEQEGYKIRRRRPAPDTNHFLRATLKLLMDPHSTVAAHSWIKLKYGPDAAARMKADAKSMQVPLISRASSALEFFHSRSVWGDRLLDVLGRLGLYPAQIDPAREAMCYLPEPDLGSLILALRQPEEYPEAGEGITVDTFHGAKGQEWDYVCIAGCNEEICPGNNDPEEERRCLFVGVTRARKEAMLFYSRRRRLAFGRKEVAELAPSRFLKEMGF